LKAAEDRLLTFDEHLVYTISMSAKTTDDDTMRDFLLVLRQALLMVVRWIEKRYEIKTTK